MSVSRLGQGRLVRLIISLLCAALVSVASQPAADAEAGAGYSYSYAAKVDGLWSSGHSEAAVKAASQARLWSMIAAGLGVVFIGMYFLLVVASSSSSGY